MLKELGVDDKTLIYQIEERFKDTYSFGSIEKDYELNTFTHYICVISDDMVVAVMNYNLIYERIEINQINVLEMFRNQGLASLLLDYLIKKAKDMGVVSITLEVKETNLSALHLYNKYGFKQVAKREGYYRGVDGILMEKEMVE